ncbi:MAG: UDP-N-acetylmuramoyl-L-alanine--D-glutamate ligase [Cyclobacteriaceae bacterium]
MQKTAILGAGESGFGAALLAHSLGHEVFVSDAGMIVENRKKILVEKSVSFEEMGHHPQHLLDASVVVKSPGIPFSHPLVKQLMDAGIPVIDELDFAFKESKGKVIAITGTNGKTTTTLLTYHLLKTAGLDVGLAGNVGQSWALQLTREDHDWWVIEVSSFQIDGFRDFHPHIAILLNITPDHLDRYDYELAHYAASKIKLMDKMEKEDHFIYFREDPIIKEGIKGLKGKPRQHGIGLTKKKGNPGFLNEGQLVFESENEPWVFEIEEMALKGKHNMVNSMAAILAAKFAGASKNDLDMGLKNFINAPHRMEWVADIGGIQFINDSKGTNVDATLYALSAYSQPIIWIAGGVDKGNDYSLLEQVVKGHVKVLIGLGKDNGKLLSAFSGKIPILLETQDIVEAIKLALAHGVKGDVALLSPACASFDLFKNYEDRGKQFKEAVHQLKIEN